MDKDIKLFEGVYLPAHETHLTEWMRKVNIRVDGKLTYQYKKIMRAMEYVTRFDAAIDVGAHCGLWSTHLAPRFSHVYAYEPVELHRRCFRLNVPQDSVVLHPCALGAKEGFVSIHTSNTSSGDSWVSGPGDIPMFTLDGPAGPPGNVGFIKLDCEGYEYFALKGAEALLRRTKPCVLVEQKPGRAQKFDLAETQAVDFLEGLGAVLRFEMSGDFCLSWGV